MLHLAGKASTRRRPVNSALGLGMQSDPQARFGATARQCCSVAAAQPRAEPARLKDKFASGSASPHSLGFQAQSEPPRAPGGYMNDLRYLLGAAKRSARQPTKALRASVLRRAVSLAQPLGGSSAAAPSSTAGTGEATAFCACAAKCALAVHRAYARAMTWPCSCNREAPNPRPNMSVNRRRHGRSARPCDRQVPSSAARPGRPVASPRLPLR
jgi:hypothetical protein